MAKDGTITNTDIIDALISEIIEQYGNKYRFAEDTGTDRSTIYRLFTQRRIGIQLFLDLVDLLDLDLVLVNRAGVNILD